MSTPVEIWPTLVSGWTCKDCNEGMKAGENCRVCGKPQGKPDGTTAKSTFFSSYQWRSTPSLTTLANWKCPKCSTQVKSSIICTNPNCGSSQPTHCYVSTESNHIRAENHWSILGQSSPVAWSNWCCERCKAVVAEGQKLCSKCVAAQNPEQ